MNISSLSTLVSDSLSGNHRLYLSMVNSSSIPSGKAYLSQHRTFSNIKICSFIVSSQSDAVQLVYEFLSIVESFYIDIEKKIAPKMIVSDICQPSTSSDLGNIFSACYEQFPYLNIIPFKANDLTSCCLYDRLIRHHGDLAGKNGLILGLGNITMKLIISLIESGSNTFIVSESNPHASSIINVLNHIKPSRTLAQARLIHSTSHLNIDFDYIICSRFNEFYRNFLISNISTSSQCKFISFTNDSIDDTLISMLNRSFSCDRLDIGPYLASRFFPLECSHITYEPRFQYYQSTRLVSHGFLASSSDVIVDDAYNPSFLVRSPPSFDASSFEFLPFSAGLYSLE